MLNDAPETWTTLADVYVNELHVQIQEQKRETARLKSEKDDGDDFVEVTTLLARELAELHERAGSRAFLRAKASRSY